ncbi:hypothetical protein HZB94_01890 [Candidatus Falkowbacteria bacterium]|nr:hypothetical protein [Candidatus Falkowbacteria bacterium]
MLQKLVLAIVAGIFFLVMMFIFGLITAVPVYFLWNWLMPALFNIKTITFLQAWGISFLASILFKSSSK